LPEGQELQILETVRDKVPAEVFTSPYSNPVGGNPEAVRANLRESMRLLKEAGFEVRDRKLVDAAGKQIAVEILVQDPSAERMGLFYKPSLERIGVTTSIRVVDDAQYQNRIRSFDFDIIMDVWPESLSPGNEQREFWGSQAADVPGSKNTIGIKNPAVDALIDKVIFAKDRVGLVAATKALDRVLLWNFYVVPQFTYGFSRYARWDRFSHAEPLPKYGRSGLPALWWFDADKAARIGKRS
jgi:microcin C transport system substrate-binding protein